MFKKVLSILLFNIFFLGTSVLCFAFTNTDFAGQWFFEGRWARGTIIADDQGNIIGGSVVVEYGDPISPTGSYTLNTDGTFTIHLTAEGKEDLDGQGAMNLNKDIVIFTEYNDEYDEYYLNCLLKSLEGSFTPADFAGHWDFEGRWARGTIIADDDGIITGGSLVVESGDPVLVTGSYTLNTDGTFTIHLTAEGKGDLDGQGAMNLSKDIVIFTEHDETQNEFYLNNLIKISESSFTNNDFSGSWIWKGRWADGKLTADDNGNIIEGSAKDEYDFPISFTGSYTLNTDGTFTIHLTAEEKPDLDGQGAMNLSKDIVTFAEYNESYSEFYLNYFLRSKRCEGDFEPDGDVDGSDLAVFAADFGRTDCSGDCEGDFDADGDVDGSDLAVFAADFGRTDCP